MGVTHGRKERGKGAGKKISRVFIHDEDSCMEFVNVRECESAYSWISVVRRTAQYRLTTKKRQETSVVVIRMILENAYLK